MDKRIRYAGDNLFDKTSSALPTLMNAAAIKFVISYNMQPGKEEPCQRFVMEEMGPVLDAFGFQFIDAWYTVWGNGPQMMGCGLFNDLETARTLLHSEEWQKVVGGLRRYATDLAFKLVQPSGAFQL